MAKVMSAKEARDKFSDVLGTVYYSKEPVIIEKQGRVFAVVISPEDYKTMLRERRERAWQAIDEIRAANKDEDPDEIERVVAQEIAARRHEKTRTLLAGDAESRP